ncbi:MAG: hypothetical protein IT285_13330 [Bdellovibrionales bacterium]|nr:hypothetical protein [Bdellovibrionales bacterium]
MRRRLPFSVAPVKIDHSFVNGGARFRAARILHLQGSDHYPIYSVVGRP